MKHRHDSTFRLLPFLSRRDDEADGDIPEIEEDRPLKQLLASVRAPLPSDALDERVLASYRHRHLGGWRAATHLVLGGRRRVIVCALAAVMVAVVATMYWFAQEPLHASVLLDQTRASEARVEASPDDAVHRVLRFEERRRPENTVVMRRRVEIWQSGALGIKARRLYDDRNVLVAGEWATESGPVNVYWARSRTRPAEPKPAATAPNVLPHQEATWAPELMWRWEPAAKEFQRAIGAAVPQVHQDADRYVLSYRRLHTADGDTADPVLLEATLTIAKRDLRSVQQSFVVRTGRFIREYRFIELAYERLDASEVSPALFEPDAELRPPTADNRPSPPARAVAPRPRPRPAAPDRALQRLEMETAYALHRLNACVEEGRSTLTVEDGRVRVTTITDRELRQALLIQGLSSVAMHERVDLDVQLRPADSFDAEPQSMRPGGRSALEVRMRDHLRARLEHQAAGDAAGSAVDAAAREFTYWVLERAEARLHHAQALQALTVRWSPGLLHERELDVVATWQQMVRDHARQIEQETEVLRLQLEPLYLAVVPPSPTAGSTSVADIRDVPRVADRLVMLTSYQYAVLQAGLDLDTATKTVSALNDAAWWSGLRIVQRLASAFAGPWSLGPDPQIPPSGETR